MTGELSVTQDETANLQERVWAFAFNFVSGASDAQSTFGTAAALAQELGLREPTDGILGAGEATLLASGPQATEELYVPGLHKYTTADHIRGLAHTIGRAHQLSSETKVQLLDEMVSGATVGYGDHNVDSPAALVKSLKKYEYEGLIRQELDAATYHSSGEVNTSLVKTHRLFVETRSHRIISRVLAAAWAD